MKEPAKGKRGPKPWTGQGRRLMPMTLIARELQVDVSTVERTLKRGLAKLRAADHSITLDWVHAAACDAQAGVKAHSAECDREFVERFGREWKQFPEVK